MGHFAKECRAPRNKEGQFKYQDNTRKQGNNEDTSSKAMLAIDGVGFDWSDMAEEQKQCDDLIVKLKQTEFTTATYKRGLGTVEEQLITYRKNEVLFSKEVAVLKREVACKDYEINMLKSEFEKVKQEKDGIEFKIEKIVNASKSLDKLLGSQKTDKSKKGLGYNVVPPPHPLIYNRPKQFDLSYSGLDEFKDPKFKSYGSEDSKQESNIVCDKKSDDSKENFDDSLVKEQVSEDTSSFVESSLTVEKENVFLDKKIEFVKPKNYEKPVKKLVRYAEMYKSQSPRWNQRNWNGQKSNQLGSDSVMYNKACFICGSFDHVHAYCKYHQIERMISRNLIEVMLHLGEEHMVVKFDDKQSTRGQDTKVPQSGGPLVKVGNEAVHKELGDKIERVATAASSLNAEQESSNINKTQSMATLNGSSP
ncbi:hypothetical protein Tco_0479293 [Tanacetum coccineum]